MHLTDYLVKANMRLMHFRLQSLDTSTDHTLSKKHIRFSVYHKKYRIATVTHPQALNTVKALITVRGAAKSCTSYPNLKYTLTLPFTLNIYHINWELK